MEQPKRRIEVVIRVSADDWEHAKRALEYAAEHAIEHGPGCNSTMGGPDAGHIILISENPEQTHEGYFAEVDEWIKLERAKSAIIRAVGGKRSSG